MGDNGKLILALKVYRYVSMVLASGYMCSMLCYFVGIIFAKLNVSCWLVVLVLQTRTELWP